MNADHDRDRSLNQALKAALRHGADAPITPACLDAETLAAWMDDGLDAPSVAMAEAHASNCARCQALIGTMARATPAAAARSANPVRLWRWWLAPLAAGAVAVTIWMVAPTDRYTGPPVPVPQTVPRTTVVDGTSQLAREAAGTPPKELSKNAPAAGKDQHDANKLADSAARANTAAGTAAVDESKRKAEGLMKQDKAAERRDRAELQPLEEQASATAAARSAAAPPPAAPEIGQLRAQLALPSDVQIITTASPSPTVTWFVGREGAVLLTVDGRTVTRVPFPEKTDLTAVTATDARTAVVTTVDGRRFRTDDGGKTWQRP